MKRYRLKVRRRIIKYLEFTTEAESMVQARAIAEANVVSGADADQGDEVEASIETCHEVLGDGDSSAV